MQDTNSKTNAPKFVISDAQVAEFKAKVTAEYEHWMNQSWLVLPTTIEQRADLALKTTKATETFKLIDKLSAKQLKQVLISSKSIWKDPNCIDTFVDSIIPMCLQKKCSTIIDTFVDITEGDDECYATDDDNWDDSFYSLCYILETAVNADEFV